MKSSPSPSTRQKGHSTLSLQVCGMSFQCTGEREKESKIQHKQRKLLSNGTRKTTEKPKSFSLNHKSNCKSRKEYERD